MEYLIVLETLKITCDELNPGIPPIFVGRDQNSELKSNNSVKIPYSRRVRTFCIFTFFGRFFTGKAVVFHFVESNFKTSACNSFDSLCINFSENNFKSF